MSGQTITSNQSSVMPANSGRSVKLRQSCDACSAAKVKCSKESSKCSRCSANNLRCVYGESRRFGRISTKKRPASRDSSATELNNAPTPVQFQAQQDIEHPFQPQPQHQHQHNHEIWPPDFLFPFENTATVTVNHGDSSLVSARERGASMSGKEPHTGSENNTSRHPSNPWSMAIDFQHLPTSLIPSAQRVPTPAYAKGAESINSDPAPQFESLESHAKAPLVRRASETFSEHPHLQDRHKQPGVHTQWNDSHINPTAAAEPQLQDKLITGRHTHNQSDWPPPARCDRCRSSAASSQPSADDIFRTNRIALQQVSRMLTCECGKDAHLAMLFATILQRVLAGYRTIIENGARTSSQSNPAHSSAHSSPMTSLPNLPDPPPLPQGWNTPLTSSASDISVRYGSFSLDQGDVDLLRQALAHGGLRRAEQVVLQMEALHADCSSNRRDSSGIEQPDHQISEDDAHVAELYKLLSGWLKSDIQKTLEKINRA